MRRSRVGSGVQRLKSGVRASLTGLLYGCGALDRLLSARLRNRAAVLMYHRVLPSRELPGTPSHPGIVVSRRTFRMQMEWLSRNCRCLALDEFLACLAGGRPFPERSCLVTFDDGWRDNYLHALPVLAELGLPAVVFLTVGFVGSRKRFWQERMVELLGNLQEACVSDPGLPPRLREDPLLEPFAGLLAEGAGSASEERFAVVSGFKGSDPGMTEATLDRLAGIVGRTGTGAEEERHFMTWSEAREMTRAGVVFGSHGVSHRILTGPGVNRETELVESRAVLEQQLGQSVRAFCYPNGNHDEETRRQVWESGYQVAFSTNPGYVSAGSDPFRLNRINVHEAMTGSIPMFLARIAGLW